MPRLNEQQRKEYTARVHSIALSRGGGCFDDVVYSSRSARFYCAEGHQFDALCANVIRKTNPSWCPYCAGNATLGIDYFQVYARQHGGECLSTDYVNNRSKLSFRCEEGHLFDLEARLITWQGSWCKECQYADLTDVDEYCAERGGRCVTRDYVPNHAVIWIECEQGHRWPTTRSHILDGRWCWACYLDYRR